MAKSPVSFVIIILFLSLACESIAPYSGSVSTDTPKPQPTRTIRPTTTPKPTATPNLSATQTADELNSVLELFAGKGYLESKTGEFGEIEPFDGNWAQLGWYQWSSFATIDSDFLYKAHFSWATASETGAESGCGVVFGIQDNNNHYAVFLDKSRILFLMHRGSYSYEVGKTKGTGRVKYGNPAEADFALAVKEQNAYVLVDGEFTEYTLSKDQSPTGEFGYSIFSGTNRDYGTSCKITEAVLWTPK